MKLPMTLRLWRSLYKLDLSRKEAFVSFTSINGSTVCYPELNDLKNYGDKTVWVRVPKAPGHPFRYLPPVFWSKPFVGTTYSPKQVMQFFRRERHAFCYFTKSVAGSVPSGWLPHQVVVQQDLTLSLVGQKQKALKLN